MKSNKLNTNKGITLIALIITIIVMLILVSVTITMAVNGGLFGYAKKAVGDTQNAINAEQELGKGKIQIGGKWYNNIDDYIAGKPIEDENGDDDGGTPESDVQIELNIAGEKVTTVPVPTGFRHKEGTIDTGYVIVNETDGNEFVWVPVDKNQKITLKITSVKDIKKVTLRDPLGDIKLTLTNEQIEKTYNNTQIEPTVNGMYFATVETEDEIVQETLVVRSLYAHEAWNDFYSTDEGLKSYFKGTPNENITRDEVIEILLSGYGFENLEELMSALGCASENEFWSMVFGITNDYTDIVDYSSSVNANGGFYIGRYEAGSENFHQYIGPEHDTVEDLVRQSGWPKSKEGLSTYKYTTFEQARGLTQGMYDSSEYSVDLLTWKAWDRTLGWIVETESKTLREVIGDSTSWGNFYNSDFSITKGKYWAGMEYEDASDINPFHKEQGSMDILSTGASDRNCANNIYDLAGNMFEWVLSCKSNDNSRHYIRGGYAGVPKHDDFNGEYQANVITRGSLMEYLEYNDVGFRAAIYLNNNN